MHKVIFKFQCRVSAILLKMNTMKYQTELKTKLQNVCDQLGVVYTELGLLLRNGANDDALYQPILKQFIDLKKIVDNDVDEGEAVCAQVGRLKAPKGEGAVAKKKPRKAVKREVAS